MERSDYYLLLLSVWLIGSALADGWFQVFAECVTIIFLVLFFLWVFIEHQDNKAASRVETWRR